MDSKQSQIKIKKRLLEVRVEAFKEFPQLVNYIEPSLDVLVKLVRYNPEIIKHMKDVSLRNKVVIAVMEHKN